MDEAPNFLAENIKYLRKAQHLTQSQLGALLGLERYHIQNYERGQQPSLPTLLILARYFGVDPVALVTQNAALDPLQGQSTEQQVLPAAFKSRLIERFRLAPLVEKERAFTSLLEIVEKNLESQAHVRQEQHSLALKGLQTLFN